jgi:hypothetical protein
MDLRRKRLQPETTTHENQVTIQLMTPARSLTGAGFFCVKARHPRLPPENQTTTVMIVTIKDNKLCIEIPLEKPRPSASGKTLVVASSSGNVTTSAMVDGKPVVIGLNAYIKP